MEKGFLLFHPGKIALGISNTSQTVMQKRKARVPLQSGTEYGLGFLGSIQTLVRERAITVTTGLVRIDTNSLLRVR